MTKLNYTQVTLCMLLLVLVGLAATDATAQGVEFGKIDNLGNSFVTWLRGTPATLFFTVAFIICGFLAAFNRISWMWVLMICVGAFLNFGAPGLVAALRSIFT